MNKFELDRRNTAICDLVLSCGCSIQSILNGTYHDNLDCATSETLAFIDEFGCVNIQKNGKKLSIRAIQKIVSQNTCDVETTTHLVGCEETSNFKLPKGCTLDTYMDELLNTQDLDTFLDKCGYRQIINKVYRGNDLPRGFRPDAQGYLYVTRVYNEHTAFIKYGLTHGDPDERHLQQIYNARRKGMRYEFENIYTTPLTCGKLLSDIELELKHRTRELAVTDEFDITKEQFPDGYTETLPVTELEWILDTIAFKLAS